jgi:rubrerythrin
MDDQAFDGRPNQSDLELIWRCLICGEHMVITSELLPDVCPSCGALKTEFERVRED